MKQLLSLVVLVIVSQVVQAVPRGFMTPDRESGSAALVMQSEKLIEEQTIPSNVIAKPEVAAPVNTIMEGKPAGMEAPIEKGFIVQ
ncbi:MAG: hypothetical protein CTY12_07875 [Methylotenera sp.]|nr:MAG: hypothetical protein CTY12_07875 [Methylotenera sp.]